MPPSMRSPLLANGTLGSCSVFRTVGELIGGGQVHSDRRRRVQRQRRAEDDRLNVEATQR